MKKMTTSVLLWDVQAELLQFAATVEDKNVSEFFRDIIVPWVAQRYGRPVPKTPVIERRGSSHPPSASSSGTHAIDLDALAGKVVERMVAIAANGKK